MSSSKQAIIRINDEVNCVIVNLHPDHLKYFYEKYGIFVSNYFFNPKFKLGRWDGKIRYFTKTGKTYVNLLDEIVPVIVELGYKVKLIDIRKESPYHPKPIDEDFFSNVIDPLSGKPWRMRDYQIEMVNILMEEGSGIGIAGTGAGKTAMTAAISKSYELAGGLRSIIIVPDKNLTAQTRRNYISFGLDTGEYSGTEKDVAHKHVVSTWQSLNRVPVVLQQFQVVIVDECHGVRGDVLTKLLNDYGKNILHRFGVTGTLPKEETDALAVKIALGPVRYEIPAHELIEQGHLAKLHIDILEMDIDLTRQYDNYINNETPLQPLTYKQFKDAYFPEWSVEKQYLQREENRMRWIANYIHAKGNQNKGNVLCLVNGINFGKRLSKIIPGSKFLHGKDDMTTRTEVYNTFKDNDNVIAIATVNIASTGLDINRIFNLIFIDVGKSFIRTIQSIGRGLRKAKDKENVLITDICSNLKYSRRHLRERTTYYREARYPYTKQTIQY